MSRRNKPIIISRNAPVQMPDIKSEQKLEPKLEIKPEPKLEPKLEQRPDNIINLTNLTNLTNDDNKFIEFKIYNHDMKKDEYKILYMSESNNISVFDSKIYTYLFMCVGDKSKNLSCIKMASEKKYKMLVTWIM